jgi:hypothetical protein
MSYSTTYNVPWYLLYNGTGLLGVDFNTVQPLGCTLVCPGTIVLVSTRTSSGSTITCSSRTGVLKFPQHFVELVTSNTFLPPKPEF